VKEPIIISFVRDFDLDGILSDILEMQYSKY